MRWTVRRSGTILATATLGLATLSQCNAGLFDHWNLLREDDGRDEVEKRLPNEDCNFGFFQTSWRPWGRCCEATDGCRSDGCTAERAIAPSLRTHVPEMSPGYSSGDSIDYSKPIILPEQETLPFGSSSNRSATDDDSPAPILMTPNKPQTDSLDDPIDALLKDSPPSSSTQSPAAPVRPAPGPVVPPQPSINWPTEISPVTEATQPAIIQPLPTPGGVPGTVQPGTVQPGTTSSDVIQLPSRRPTSRTIDIPQGATGATLPLPGSAGAPATTIPPGRAGIPFPQPKALPQTGSSSGVPEVAPPATPAQPQPSLRRMPPLPTQSTLPGSASNFQMPQTVPGYHQGAFYEAPNAHRQPGNGWRPAANWQPVSQQSVQQYGQWRVMQQFPQSATQDRPRYSITPQAHGSVFYPAPSRQ